MGEFFYRRSGRENHAGGGDNWGQAIEKRKQNIECPNCGLSVSLSDLCRGHKRTCRLGLHPGMFGSEFDSKKMTQIS